MIEDERRALMRAVGIGALVFVAVMAFGAPRFMGDGENSPMIGQAAPDFTLEIVAGDGTGDRVSVSSLRGRVVMLDFWASWCPPCRESIPILGRVAARHAGEELTSFAVNTESDQSPQRVIAAHRALGIAIPTLLDRSYQAQSAFDVQALPTLVLIDRAGIVRHLHTGVPDEAGLDRWIAELLAQH
jgi:cytochrome c biogenesis protein CcmG/thiol:disulfide interchange protein DsbE